MLIRAEMPWRDGSVGAFNSFQVMHRFVEAFPEAIVCIHDSFAGYAERVLKAGDEVLERTGRYPSIPVESYLRKITNFAPRYEFRIRFGLNRVARGSIDRWSVRISYDLDDEFPELMRQRFLTFLRSLELGHPRILEYPGSAAERAKLERRDPC